jgi:NADH:ubiquinone oxidoreductase subunit 2 (subunit N)
MLWSSMPELDLCFGLIMIIVYGLFSLRNQHVYLVDVYFFCRMWPLLLMCNYMADGGIWVNGVTMENFVMNTPSLDVLLCLLTFVILQSFKSFESVLLLMFAYVGQLFMLHSCDLVSFYVCLEAQNFCFLVLCGLQPGPAKSVNVHKSVRATNFGYSNTITYNGSSAMFSVEASIKYLLLSAFSSGVILFWFSALYLRTGMSVLFFKSASIEFSSQLESFQILLAMMFKLGAAPLHLWVVDIYGSVKRQLLMYISTAPKLSLFGFWVSAWHQVWTDFSVAMFVVFSMLLGSFGAYGQPALRTLIAYSTISEIGILLMAVESAGFHSLFQHLTIYIVTQLLLWNLSDKRLFSLIAVSLAGLPPLSGFFTKAFIFWHVANQELFFLLAVALFCTALALVYYLRIVRLFQANNGDNQLKTLSTSRSIALSSNSYLVDQMFHYRVELTSTCAIILGFAPLFLIKPFVL